MTIAYETNWRKRLRRRLYWQFRNLPNITAWADMIAAQAQDLEDAAQLLLTIVNIDDSVGAQLDVIGRVVGQIRAGASDAIYRLYLKARIIANRSSGTPEQLFSIMRALFGSTAAPRYYPGFVKQFVLDISGAVLTREQALVGTQFLVSKEESGARGIFKWHESPTAALFRFDIGPGFDVGVFAGALDK